MWVLRGKYSTWLYVILWAFVVVAGLIIGVVKTLQEFNVILPSHIFAHLISLPSIVLILAVLAVLVTIELRRHQNLAPPKPLTFFEREESMMPTERENYED